jgi:hypothetical protein
MHHHHHTHSVVDERGVRGVRGLLACLLESLSSWIGLRRSITASSEVCIRAEQREYYFVVRYALPKSPLGQLAVNWLVGRRTVREGESNSPRFRCTITQEVRSNQISKSFLEEVMPSPLYPQMSDKQIPGMIRYSFHQIQLYKLYWQSVSISWRLREIACFYHQRLFTDVMAVNAFLRAFHYDGLSLHYLCAVMLCSVNAPVQNRCATELCNRAITSPT